MELTTPVEQIQFAKQVFRQSNTYMEFLNIEWFAETMSVVYDSIGLGQERVKYSLTVGDRFHSIIKDYDTFL